MIFNQSLGTMKSENKENKIERVNQLHHKHTLSHHHHMRIRWQEFFTSDNITPAKMLLWLSVL